MCWSRGQHVGQRDRAAGPVDRQPPHPLDRVRHVVVGLDRHAADVGPPTPTARSRCAAGLAQLQDPGEVGDGGRRAARRSCRSPGSRRRSGRAAPWPAAGRTRRPPRRPDRRPRTGPRPRRRAPARRDRRRAAGCPRSARTTRCSLATGRLADLDAVVDLRRAAERALQYLLGPQPDLGGVPVPGQVHQAGHVPAVDVLAQEQPGLAALAQHVHARGDGRQVGRPRS